MPVYTDDGKIGNGLTKKGEDIRLIDTMATRSMSSRTTIGPANSPSSPHQRDGGAFVPHTTTSPIEAPFHPDTPQQRGLSSPTPSSISEVLADPPSGLAGDANRDGRPDPYEDEFIELYNAGPAPISLAGWRLGDAGSLSEYFRFPRKASLPPVRTSSSSAVATPWGSPCPSIPTTEKSATA